MEMDSLLQLHICLGIVRVPACKAVVASQQRIPRLGIYQVPRDYPVRRHRPAVPLPASTREGKALADQ